MRSAYLRGGGKQGNLHKLEAKEKWIVVTIAEVLLCSPKVSCHGCCLCKWQHIYALTWNIIASHKIHKSITIGTCVCLQLEGKNHICQSQAATKWPPWAILQVKQTSIARIIQFCFPTLQVALKYSSRTGEKKEDFSHRRIWKTPQNATNRMSTSFSLLIMWWAVLQSTSTSRWSFPDTCL